MKKTILLALIWVAAFGCNQKESVAPQVEGESTLVAYRKAANVADLKVDLTEVADSRCPLNAVCVWAGSAKLKFNISDGKNETKVDVEFKGDKSKDFQEFSLGGQSYIIHVREVTPYPNTSESPKLEDYKVNITVEKK
jgi:hypothetical protein